MKKIALLLGIICLLVFIGCGQDEENQQSTRENNTGNVEEMEEKAEKPPEAMDEKTSEADEAVEKESRETDEERQEKSAEPAKDGFPGVITMKNENAFPQHRMGIIDFDHEEHAEEYGIGCGECHHDEKGEPLTNLERGDEVQSCYECHDKDGKPSREPSMSREEFEKEQLDYYYGAIHESCTECHKEMGGPVSCTECHPKPQQ